MSPRVNLRRKRFILFLMMSAVISVLFLTHPGRTADKSQQIFVIPVIGTVEPGMAAFIRRSLADIHEQNPDAVVVLKLDTFGGRLDAALEIISTIPQSKAVSFVEKRAISAGALIALAGSALVMKQNTLIGDCAPIIQISEGQKEVAEKIKQPWWRKGNC